MKPTKIKSYSGMKISPERAKAAFRSNPENSAEAARKNMIKRQLSRGKTEKKAGNKR